MVAAIEGYRFGGGALVAVAADIRIASSSARISLPPAKLGLVYPASSIRHLVALVGPSRAKLLLLTAEIVNAYQALEFGLVDRVLSPETFDDGVLRADPIHLPVGRRSPKPPPNDWWKPASIAQRT